MPSINDWAAKAAERIYDTENNWGRKASVDRIAAIIATFAEPLMQVLRESKREHQHCEDSFYCCRRCTSPDHFLLEGETLGGDLTECTCGADAWNARVDAALDGLVPKR